MKQKSYLGSAIEITNYILSNLTPAQREANYAKQDKKNYE